jgi:hypothetical protein
LNHDIAGNQDAGELATGVADVHAIHVELLGAVGDAIIFLCVRRLD